MPNDHVMSYQQQQGLLNTLGERPLLAMGPLVRETAMRGLLEAALTKPEFGPGVFEPLLAGPKIALPSSLRALIGLAEQFSPILPHRRGLATAPADGGTQVQVCILSCIPVGHGWSCALGAASATWTATSPVSDSPPPAVVRR